MAADETTQLEKSSFWMIFRNNVCPPLNVKEDEDISTAQFDDTPQSSGINHDEIYKSPAQVIEQPEDLKRPDETAQEGVQAMEAITLTWTKTSVGALYVLMFMIYLVNAFQSTVTASLGPFVVSAFESHSLLPVISVVSNAFGAGIYMPLAKILNMWDRSIGFLAMAVLATLGLILSAVCDNVATYAVAQTFYTIGFNGLIFSVDVVTADTSTLRDRGLAYAFTSSPWIITSFAGPVVANYFHARNWRWAYGAFAIILPVVAMPMFLLLRYNRHLAKKRGLLQETKHVKQSVWATVKYLVIELDLLGVTLLTAGLVLFFLPFTLAGDSADGWDTPDIIVMIVVGFCCFAAFVLVERYVAPVPFIPWRILASRTVLAVCLLDLTYTISYYCWDDYYTSYLQVVYGTSVTIAGFINNIFTVISGVWLLIVGLAIKRSARYRWTLVWSVPIYILGGGLLIYFRKPYWGVGWSVMCQVLLAFGGGTIIIAQQVAVLAAADHSNVASALALLNMFGTIGDSAGSSISGAIWTNTLPEALHRLLPEFAQSNFEKIYNSLNTQLSYPRGSATRTAIAYAYAVAQKRMVIAATVIMIVPLICVFIMRDIKLSKSVQTKGVLF